MFCGSSLQLPFLRSHCMRRRIRDRAENEAFRHQSLSIGRSLSQPLAVSIFRGLNMSRQISECHRCIHALLVFFKSN